MSEPQADAATFAANFAKIAEQSQAIFQEFMARNSQSNAFGTGDPLHIGSAFAEWFTHIMNNPQKVVEIQMNLWQDTLNLWQHTMQKFLGEETAPVIQPDSRDKRFKDTAWQESVIFDFIKQSYLLTARWMQQSVSQAQEMDPQTLRKIDFYTRQFVDAMAPSNFLLTNPEVLKKTLETGGENIVRGLTNMLEDLEKSKGALRVSMTDHSAFEVGKNLAVTKGKVVYQNDLIQLIQYAPLTEKVHAVPMLIIPPWINKYYILDLQPENSLVRWLVSKGFTVFVISWVNPDENLGHKRFDDYMLEGIIAALDAIEKATGEKQINATGYCLGGTLLAITLSYLKAKKLADRIKSATYLTTMVDFREAGELSVFIDEEQLKSLESRMSGKGYLDGDDMAVTFNMLRANDLIWSFVINNYLLGKDPFPFDLLYWNSDSTRMPAAMHSFYLRNMYQKNLLIDPGKITIAGVPVNLQTIDTPTYMLSTREDHIAPWKSTYAATQIYKGIKRFVLAASGHIAGVVNPPAKQKYSYWIADSLPQSPDEWFQKASEIKGSWWDDWEKWLETYSGGSVPAREPGKSGLKALEEAPGSFVKVRS
ncbi:MAG TPA: class I poly(R)-hydroxyalkanoic acid synthase [Rickettsiales bacterium]|nr:class I poly(R)-hydroxyalkanoic acid synthase [Rickettsiales bacterium]